MEAEILYEDFVTGLRAHFLVTRVWQDLGIQGEPQLRLRRFDVLGHPKLLAPAAAAALPTSLVMLSAHGVGPVPEPVLQWVGEWLAGLNANPGSIIVSLDAHLAERADQLPFLQQLQGLIQQGTADAVPCFFEPPELGSLVWRRQMHERLNRPLAGLPNLECRHSSIPDWGINE